MRLFQVWSSSVAMSLALVQSKDSCIKSVLPETIGYIGMSLEGKSALIELGNKMRDLLDKLTTLGYLQSRGRRLLMVMADSDWQSRDCASIKYLLNRSGHDNF